MKGDGNRVTGKEEKREAEEKISGCSEGGYGRSWCEGEGHWEQDAVEKHHALWKPLIKGKGQKKKICNEIKHCGPCIALLAGDVINN